MRCFGGGGGGGAYHDWLLGECNVCTCDSFSGGVRLTIEVFLVRREWIGVDRVVNARQNEAHVACLQLSRINR